MWQELRQAQGKLSESNLNARLFWQSIKVKFLLLGFYSLSKILFTIPTAHQVTNIGEAMASNLMMWEAIKFGKNWGLKSLTCGGALGPNPDPKIRGTAFTNSNLVTAQNS